MWEWIVNNKEWVFGGIGVAAIGAIIRLGIDYWRTKQASPRGIEFEIKKLYIALERGGLTLASQELKFEEEIVVEVLAPIFISKQGPSTSVAFYIAAIEPDCLQDGVVAKTLMVSVEHQINPHRSPVVLENPLYLKSDEMNGSIQIQTKIPFSLSKIENKLGSLYSLKSISITLGAKQTGRKPILRSKSCELTEIHNRFEEEVATKIQHLQNFKLSPKQVLQVLKRYWLGPGEQTHLSSHQ